MQPWIEPGAGDDLPGYARRMAAVIEARVDRRRRLLLGGSSFGGMLALEVARILRPDGVVLIGSCRDLRGVRPSLAALLPIAPRVPLVAHRLFARLGWWASFAFGARDDDDRRLFAAMLRSSPPRRVQWACGAMAGWRPLPLPGVPVFALHGGDDRLLPAERARSSDPEVVVVAGAGHLLPLTHPEPTNAFLRSVLLRSAARAPD